MERKNILLMIGDGHQIGSLGCYGNPVIQTPYIDALAEQGTLFHHCLTPSPSCHLAHNSMWTGVLPHRYYSKEKESRRGQSDSLDESLIKPFVKAGYHTVYAGKWHVTGRHPRSFGFLEHASITDTDRDSIAEGRFFESYRNYVTKLGYQLAASSEIADLLTERDLSMLSQSGKVPCGTSEIPLKHYPEPWITQQAIQALERRPSEKPFWLVVSYRAPHFPLSVPDPYDRLYSAESVSFPPNFQNAQTAHPGENIFHEDEWRKLITHYWGFCSLIDAQVGTLVYYLEENDLLKDTIMIYTSDHGEMLGAHGIYAPHEHLHYEELIHIPLIIVCPGAPGNQEVQECVSLIDLVPTLAEWSNIPLNENIDGKSLAASFTRPDRGGQGRDDLETLCFSEHPHAQQYDVTISLRTPRGKYIFNWADEDELYNLARDPYETCNLGKTAHSALRHSQTRMLQKIIAETPVFGQKLKERMKQKYRDSENLQLSKESSFADTHEKIPF